MLNYLRAEFYKLFRRKYTWITLAVLLGIEAFILLLFAVINETAGEVIGFNGCCEILVQFLIVGIFLPIFTCDMVCASPYKDATLKNEVSFGISRFTIYFGKLIAQLIASLVLCALMAGFFVGLAAVLMPHDPVTDPIALRHVGQGLALALPVWIGIQGACCACTFLYKSNLGSVITVLCLLTAIPYGIYLAGMFLSFQEVDALMHISEVLTKIADFTPISFVNNLYYWMHYEGWQWSIFGRGCAMGGGWLAVSTALGLLGIIKREIN